ncbi:MAG: hypothetical protein WAM42_09430 [Candidatus Nitrosopolaris sp.]
MMVETYFFLDMAMNSSDHNKITMWWVNSREIINNNLVVEDLMNDDQLNEYALDEARYAIHPGLFPIGLVDVIFITVVCYLNHAFCCKSKDD